MDRRGHHAQGVTRQHHHDRGAARKMGQKLSMTRKGKARPVLQGFFVDGQRTKTQRLAGLDQIDRARYHVNNTLGVGWVGMACGRYPCKAVCQYRQHALWHKGRLIRTGDFGKARALGQMARIAQPEEGQVWQGKSGQHGNLGPDARSLSFLNKEGLCAQFLQVGRCHERQLFVHQV